MHLYLDYIEILNLASLSSEFRAECVEKYLPGHVRREFVSRIDGKLDPNQHSACYLCFRVKRIAEFQLPGTMAGCARVVQRNALTGQRVFEVVPDPPPPSQVAIPHTVPLPSLPMPLPLPLPLALPLPPMGLGRGVGDAMDSFFFGTAVQPGLAMAVGSPGSSMGSMGSIGNMGAAVARPPPDRRPYRSWHPQPPGEAVGNIERLPSYCIACALETRLIVAGDVIEPRSPRFTSKLWVCGCQVARTIDGGERCPACGMAAVYRTAASRRSPTGRQRHPSFV